jgi:ATP-dependent DNA helicase RecQ
MTALQILQKYWQYDSFRDSQEEIIQTVLDKKDVIALLPTGGGKSLCYQIPGLMQKGICVVVSPLIALMQDQVSNLQKKGIDAIAIIGSMTESEIVVAFDNMQFGKTKFLYISPEKLQSNFIKDKLKQLTINLIAVDEAHCISEWGHDFRSSYLKIELLRELFPEINILALTATATDRVVKDIQKYLKLSEVKIFKTSFARKNLAYQIYKTDDVFFKLKQMLTKNKKPCIIYVFTRKQTKDLSDYLNANNFKSAFYHGGMTASQKERAYQDWMNEKTLIMVATNAFGMGIDKDNVKLVVHLNIPQSIENYMQEAGRAGRNNQKSFAVLLYNDASIYNFEKKVKKSIVQIRDLKAIYFKLNQHFRIALGEQPKKHFTFDLSEFCFKYNLDLLTTYNALIVLDREGVLLYETNLKTQSSLKFICTNQELFRYKKGKKQLKYTIDTLLRYYGGIFENNIQIDEYLLAKKLNLPQMELIRLLKVLEADKIIQYRKKEKENKVQFLVMREDDKVINRIKNRVLHRNKLKVDKKEAIINYITNDYVCRSAQLLQYFKEENYTDCGICDVCLSKNKNKTDKAIMIEEVFNLINKKKTCSVKELVLLLPFYEDEIIESIIYLLEKNAIKQNDANKYFVV